MITIYGAGDDLVEVEGDIREEFPHAVNAPAMIACSDGTLVRIVYDPEGIWRITTVAVGSDTTIDLQPGRDDRAHSDRIVLHADIHWVVYTTPGRDDRLVHAIKTSDRTTTPAAPPAPTGLLCATCLFTDVHPDGPAAVTIVNGLATCKPHLFLATKAASDGMVDLARDRQRTQGRF